MKKLFILFLCIFTTESFASGIASNTASAPCTNTTLETYSGNSNLAADWQPNEIQLRWYNNNTLMDVQTSANTCVYDGTLTIPQTAPTRTGYTFAGWQVRPEMDFATIPINERGAERWAKGLWNDANYCWYDTNTDSVHAVNCDSDSTYKELQPHEWKVKFNHGDLYGMAGCSTVSGTYTQPGHPTIGTGLYCWCKATGYKPSSSNVINGPLLKLSWVFNRDFSSESSCTLNCARDCADGAEYSHVFRTALFTPASN